MALRTTKDIIEPIMLKQVEEVEGGQEPASIITGEREAGQKGSVFRECIGA